MTNYLKMILFVTFFCFSQTYAALSIVSNDGNTVDATSYLILFTQLLQEGALATIQENPLSLAEQPVPKRIIEDPIPTDFTVGRIISHLCQNLVITQPIFVMGDDAFSIDWAHTHAVTLRKLGAIGFITHVSNEAQLKAIEDQTQLTLFPANLLGLHDVVSVRHYPFLITNQDIEQ